MKNLLLAVLLFVAFALFAAVTPAELKTQSDLATSEKFPNADSVLLFDWQSATYQTDGTGVEVDDFYQKILTESGRRDLRELSLHFNETYEKLEVPLLEIVKPDGKIVKIDTNANMRIAIDSGQTGANIYDPANKVMSVAVPGLEIGDVIHLVTRQTILKPRIPKVWSNIFVLQSNTPVLHYEVKINAPESMPLEAIRIKDEVKNTITFSKKKQDGRVIYTWVAKDVPQIIPEPDMPPMYLCVQRLLVSTAKDWPAISRWYYNLCLPLINAITPEIREKVTELIKDCKTPDAKIMALFQFVSQQIRYMGITAESEAPGYEPHDVSMTFNRRYGVCRDKAALLVSMLQLAGLKAYPVLFMAGYPKDDEVPNNYFNHAIVAVEDAPNHYILMDPTYETTTELLPSTMTNMSFLAAKPDGDVLRRSAPVAAAKNLLKIKTVANVNPDGVLSGRSTLDFGGVNDQIYRDAFSRWPNDYRFQFFAAQLKRAIAGAELDSLKIFPENIRDMSLPLSAELSFHVNDFLPQNSSVFLLNLPCLGTKFGAVNFVLGSVGLKTRKFPMQLFSTCAVAENFSLSLPTSCQVLSLPENAMIKTPGVMAFNRSLRQENSTIYGENYFSIDTVDLSPAGYAQLKRSLAKIDTEERKKPIAQPNFDIAAQKDALLAFPGANSIVLLSSTKVKLNDQNSWTRVDHTVRKILTYAGVKEHSELKIAFNPAWESVTIDAKIIAPDGTVKTLSPEEVNLMDAPWVSSAPRYPAGKILVASLPGIVPGATVEISVSRTYREHPFFGTMAIFAADYPIVSKSFTVDAPKNMLIKHSVAPENVIYTEQRDNPEIHYSWSAKNLSQQPAEPGRPALWIYAPTVTISAGDYADFAKKLSVALMRKTEESPKATALARELAPESLSLEDRVNAIRAWVARHIRAAGPALNEAPWSCFTPADVTLQSNYGNSADRAILLGAMLKAIGIDFKFVAATNLGSANATIRPLQRTPQNIFTKILIYVPTCDSFLNDTEEYAALGVTAAEESIGLTLDSGRLMTIRPPQKKQSFREFLYRVALKSDGSARIVATCNYYGLEYQTMRRLFAEMTPAERDQYFETLASGIFESAELFGNPTTDFDKYPGSLHFTLDVPNFAAVSGKFLQFELPNFSVLSDLVKTAAANRKTPFWRNRPSGVSVEYRIALPPNFVVAASGPALLKIGETGSVFFSRRIEKYVGVLAIEYNLALPVELISPLEYGTLIELQKELSKLSESRIILEQVGK
ncbi:MAG: DUF3857 domain-containing protein [Victivallales bacterium]|jgi:transglutaminase-like putative cysteine protease|nr:DUF3857 domain-containing protein [Victivallales bacterium]